MNPKESQATVVVNGPVPLTIYCQIKYGLEASRPILKVTGLSIRNGPSKVVT